MQNPEQPSGSQERVDAGEAFGRSLRGLDDAMGPASADLPARPGTADLEAAERAITSDGSFGGLNEQFRSNELIHRRRSLELRAQVENGGGSLDELAVANQAVAYHEYIPGIIRDIQDTMRRYAVLRRSADTLPPSLRLQELQASIYMDALSKASRERVAFANVLLAEGKMAKGGDAKELGPMRDRALASPDLSAESRAALTGTDDRAKWARGNALNQQIIDLLSGKATVSGIEKGFLPQKLYLELLTLRYREVLDEQKKIVRLQGEAPDKNARLDALSEERRRLTDELLHVTDDLAGDQMHRAELSIIQRQFGDRFDFEGVRAPSTDRTPEELRASMREHMRQRGEFHMQRMGAFMESFEGEALGEGLLVRVEDISNKKGRELVHSVTHGLARLFTIPVPEALGLKEMARSALSEPLDKALGWPAGKETWEELTPEEQAAVEAKARSILDAVRAFDRSTIERFRSTLSLIQSMPPADQLAASEPVDPLPAERVTAENRDALIARYGAQTVYLMLFRQLDADWGSDEPPSGFMGQYAILLESVNANIDVHVEVSDALYQLGDNYNQLKEYLLWLAAAAFAGGLLVRPLARAAARTVRATWRTGKWALRKMPKGPMAAVALAEGQMMLERTVAHALIVDREERRLKAAEQRLDALKKGEDADGRKLSPAQIGEASRACAADIFAAILQMNHVGEATVLPHKAAYEMTQPDQVLFFEAYVAAQDILGSHGFPDLLELPPGYAVPTDATGLSQRAREALKTRKEAVPRPRSAFAKLEEGPVSLPALESAAKSTEFAIAYDAFEKTANRTEILWTMGRLFRWKYDMFTKIEEPARKPDLLTSATHRRAIEEIISAGELRAIDAEARALADLSPKQFLLMAAYLEKHPPTNEEILRWYNGAGIAARGVERSFGPENARKPFLRKSFDDWSVARAYADTYVPGKAGPTENPGQAQIEKMQARYEKGKAYMKEINANDNGSYYTKQYGFWGNYFLYIQFDAGRGKWQCDLGERKDMQDPVEGGKRFHNTGISWGAGNYNDVADKLARINEDKD